MAYYPKRRTTFRRTTPRSSRFAPARRMPYAGAKRRTMAPTRSFGAAVKKANLAQAQSKNVSACFMNHALHHNKWYMGKTTTGTVDAAVTSYKFQNMFADITHGTDDHQRVGDEIYLEKLSLRMFLSSGIVVCQTKSIENPRDAWRAPSTPLCVILGLQQMSSASQQTGVRCEGLLQNTAINYNTERPSSVMV